MSDHVDEVEEDDEDLGDCPYFARYSNIEGHDPHAICYQMGLCEAAEEPLCVTCEPTEGWVRPPTLLATPGYTPVPEDGYVGF